jgi:hypothetical protein
MSDIKTTYAESDDALIVHREQNVGAIVDYAKARHNEGHHGFSDFQLKMVLPAVVVEHYCNFHQISFKEFMNNPEHVKRMNNSPEFSDLRVAPGRM